MKMNMIVGKKQIVLASLVLALGVAVYLNWQYAKTSGSYDVTNALESNKNYGDAQYVDKNLEDMDDETYFAEAKMVRQKSRDEAVESLKTMLADAELASVDKADLALQAADLAKSIETEGKIENIMKAKGFHECMVYFDTQRVDVVVKTEGLEEEQAAQIKDIILKEVSVPIENISIIEVN